MGKQNSISLEFRVKALEDEVKQMKIVLKGLSRDKRLEETNELEEERIMNFNEVLKLLKIPRHILYAKVLAGEIPSFRVGKLYKFEKSKLVAWQTAEKYGSNIDVDEYVEQYMQRHSLKA